MIYIDHTSKTLIVEIETKLLSSKVVDIERKDKAKEIKDKVQNNKIDTDVQI